MSLRCGKCAPCKRWVETLDKAETCEMSLKPREGEGTQRYDPEGDHERRIERLRVLLKRQGERRAAA